MYKFCVLMCCALLTAQIGFAQSGGIFEIKQSVTANAGGGSAGGVFMLEGTAGQTLIDVSNQVPFAVESGFWTSSFTPTAAGLSVSGRVKAPGGIGLRNAVVTLTMPDGSIRSARTASFGNFRFDDIEAGATVILSVNSKRFAFQPMILTLTDHVSDLEFTVDE